MAQTNNNWQETKRKERIKSRRRQREAALERERLIQEQRDRERRQQTIIGAVTVAIIVIAALVIGGALIYNNYKKNHQDVASGRQERYAAVQAVKVKPSYATSEGGFVLSKNGIGKKAAGAPTVEEYMDFICPGCGSANRALDATLIKMVDAGQINLEVHPEGFLDASSTDNYSNRAAAAVVYVLENDPNHALQFITSLFSSENQPGEASNYVPVTNAKIQKIARSAGVDATVAKKSTSGKYTAWVQAMAKYTPYRSELWNVSGSNKGAMTTPTFRINKHFWDYSASSKSGSDWKTLFLHAIGMNKANIGVTGKLPSIGASGKPIA